MRWNLPPVDDDTSTPRLDPREFYDRIFFYTLSSIEYRIDPSDCPEPLVTRSRGAPTDLSPGLASFEEDEIYLLHWLYPSEVLLYDWGAYERFMDQQIHQFEQRYELRNGRPPPARRPLRAGHHAPVEFLDVVAALDPLDDHRLIFGME